MADPLDFRTALVVFALIRLFQAMGLVYVWRIHRRYVPARNWAIGSVLVAAGALLVAMRGQFPSDISIIASNTLIFTGMMVFDAGIVQACERSVPWRAAIAVCVAAISVSIWPTVAPPSVAARIVVLSCVTVIFDGYAAAAALRAPRGPMRGTQWFIAGLLIVEAGVSVIRAVGAVRLDPASVLYSSPSQAIFVVCIIGTSFMLGLALAVLTSQRLAMLLATANARFNAAINNLSQGLALFDSEHRIVFSNEKFATLYGLSPGQVKAGVSLAEIYELRIKHGVFAGPSPERYLPDRLKAVDTNSARIDKLNDGRDIRITHEPMPEGGWITTHEDVTDRQRAAARIAFMAHHDLLTGLANRGHYLEKLGEAVARLRRSGEAFAVLMLDLDRFKNINDSLGHPAGDALLKETARRLKACLRETDTLARFGGDEFAVIETQIADPQESVMVLANRIIGALAAPFDLDGIKANVGVSIGIAVAPHDGRDHNELMKKADLALYAAKSRGRNRYCFFDIEMAAGQSARQQLENELRDAQSRDELEIHYQPIVEIRSGAPRGAEALVRWNHPERGFMHADQFIPLAEESGLIIPLGEWVLRKACIDAARWPAHLSVAVNVSAAHFRNGNLVDLVSRALADANLPPQRLELDVTEAVLLEDEAQHLAMLHQLRKIGVSIALDDFGTGYSSLSQLTRFAFDKIKIDTSIAHSLARRAESAAIVSSVVALAHSLGATTVAEGVETAEQFDLLRAAGVALAQGFLFGQPCAASQLEWDRVRATA